MNLRTAAASATVVVAAALTIASLAWSLLCPAIAGMLMGSVYIGGPVVPYLIVAMFAPLALLAAVVWALPIGRPYKRILTATPLVPAVGVAVLLGIQGLPG